MSRTIGGGDRGNILTVPMNADTTLTAEITSLIANGTPVVGKLISIGTSDDYTVTSPAASDDPDGMIITQEGNSTDGYLLGCEIWGYTDLDSAVHSAHCIKTFTASGTPTLGYFVKVTGDTYDTVREAATAGLGKVIKTTSTSVDVLI